MPAPHPTPKQKNKCRTFLFPRPCDILNTNHNTNYNRSGGYAITIFIDADGCPVVDITVSLARKYQTDCVILCDTAHVFNKEGARTVTVSKGADSVDFALVNMLRPGDLVVTQDYGLAAMCLARRAVPISQDGVVYHDGNIGSLLQARHEAKKIRSAGGRLKGPRKRTPEQNAAFSVRFEQLLRPNDRAEGVTR